MRDVESLSQLDDHELKDIGLTRDQLRWAVSPVNTQLRQDVRSNALLIAPLTLVVSLVACSLIMGLA